MKLYYWGNAFIPSRFWKAIVTSEDIDGAPYRRATRTEVERAKSLGDSEYCLGDVSDRFQLSNRNPRS